jgi:hypothetical protein
MGSSLRDELDELIVRFKVYAQVDKPPVTHPAEVVKEQIENCHSMESTGGLNQESDQDYVIEIPLWVKHIPEGLMRELEETLRMNNAYWDKKDFSAPPWDGSFTTTYFSQQAKRLRQLQETADDFSDSLQQIHPGSNRFRTQVSDLLNRVLNQTTQVTQLIRGASRHPLGITIEKAAVQVVEDVQKTKRVLRQIALKAIGGPNIPTHLSHQLTTSLSSLSISLDELRKHVQEVSHEANDIYVSLN